MRIKLEYPYSQDWDYGRIWINRDGRKTLTLIGGNNTVTSYARYLMAVKIKKYLTEDEEVDHIDTDHTNDDIKNLQILTVAEHKIKTFNEQSGKIYNTFICKCCNESFEREVRQVKPTTKYCSKECNWKMNPPPKSYKSTNNIPISIDYDKVLNLINDGLSDADIARELNISRGSVLNYRTSNSIPSKKFDKRVILEENIDEITNLLLTDTKKVDIMKKYDVSKNTLYSFLKRNNLL